MFGEGSGSGKDKARRIRILKHFIQHSQRTNKKWEKNKSIYALFCLTLTASEIWEIKPTSRLCILLYQYSAWVWNLHQTETMEDRINANKEKALLLQKFSEEEYHASYENDPDVTFRMEASSTILFPPLWTSAPQHLRKNKPWL